MIFFSSHNKGLCELGFRGSHDQDKSQSLKNTYRRIYRSSTKDVLTSTPEVIDVNN